MNTNQSSKKNILIIVGIVLVAMIALFYFMGGDPVDQSSLLSGEESSETERLGTRVLSLLNQIESLNIDTTLFTSATYQTLVDYSVVIPPQGVGRPNPFAPLPGVRTSTR